MIIRRLAALALAFAPLTAVATPAVAQDENTQDRPALQPLRVSGQVVVGATAGYLGYFAGRFVGVQTVELFSVESSGRRQALINAFGYTAAGAATAGAVYGIGSVDGQTGDFGATLLGAGAGFGVAVLTNHFVFRPRSTPESAPSRAIRVTAEVIEVLLPAIGATIGFNSTRKYVR